MRGRGANFLTDPQNGNAIRHTTPMTSIAIIFLLAHPFFALEAIVRGIKIKAKAPLRRTIPLMSSSDHKVLSICRKLMPFH